MKPTTSFAPLFVRCVAENGQLTRQYRSYDNTVNVVIDVIPVEVIENIFAFFVEEQIMFLFVIRDAVYSVNVQNIFCLHVVKTKF